MAALRARIAHIVSPSTATKDKDEDPKFYAKVFRTPEYFWYDPRQREIGGYRL